MMPNIALSTRFYGGLAVSLRKTTKFKEIGVSDF